MSEYPGSGYHGSPYGPPSQQFPQGNFYPYDPPHHPTVDISVDTDSCTVLNPTTAIPLAPHLDLASASNNLLPTTILTDR